MGIRNRVTICHVRRRFCMLRTGVLQDSMAPCPIELCWRVFGELYLARRLGFPSLRVAPTRFSAGVPSKCQRMRVRQAVIFSHFHLFIYHTTPRHPKTVTAHSLPFFTSFVHSILHFPPDKHRCTALALGPPHSISQSIPPHVVTHHLATCRHASRYSTEIQGQLTGTCHDNPAPPLDHAVLSSQLFLQRISQHKRDHRL